MVEKKYRNLLHLSVPESKARFKLHAPGLKARFDQSLLQDHLPPTSGVIRGDETLLKSIGTVMPEQTRIAFEATEFVNVFGRVLSDQSGHPRCLQYLYVWDYQAVPAHEADYEPIFVFLDGPNRFAIYDLVHYCSRRMNLGSPGAKGPGLRMVPGWHSFLPDFEMAPNAVDKGLHVQPLSDQHLEAWWTIPEDEPRLKIKEYMRDPFLLEAPGHFLKNPDDSSRTICCTFLEIERALREFEDPREGLIEGIKRAFSKCVGILGILRLVAFVQLLNEMQDVGLVKMPTPLRAGLNLASLGNMLRDGFVSMTKAGRAFFDGMTSMDNEEDHSGHSVTGPVV
ncbi:MAG: hypothetical protein ACFFER_04665 [Candidatus Thorarchaeota archaeon]